MHECECVRAEKKAALCILGSVRRRGGDGSASYEAGLFRPLLSHSFEANLCRSLELFQASASTHPGCPPKRPNPFTRASLAGTLALTRLPCESPACLVSDFLGCP